MQQWALKPAWLVGPEINTSPGREGQVHPELTTMARDGSLWPLVNTAGRKEWMPALGERTPRPVFLTLGQHPDFDRLSSQRGTTWWERWLETGLGREVLVPERSCEPLYHAAIEMAEAVGLCVRTTSQRGIRQRDYAASVSAAGGRRDR